MKYNWQLIEEEHNIYSASLGDERNTTIYVSGTEPHFEGSWSDCGNNGEFEIKSATLAEAQEEAEGWADSNLPITRW